MNKAFILTCLMAYSVFLAACAPAAKGSSSAYAFDVSNFEAITVTSGARWYVKDVWGAQAFGIDLGGLSRSNFSSNSRSTSSLTGRFRLVEASAPDDWQLRLVSVRGVKEVTSLNRTSYGASAYYQSTVELVLTVDVPPATPPGSYALKAVVSADSGKSQTIPIQVTVEAETLATAASTLN